MTQRGGQLTLLGVLLAVAITAAMDATGYSVFSALPLLPLLAVLWRVEGLSRRSVGLIWGRGSDYVRALAHPVLVIGLLVGIGVLMQAVDLSTTNWRKALLNCALNSLGTFIGVILTEEGFFRGWLWASLERAGSPETKRLIWSSLSFALWHVSEAVLRTGFEPPRAQVPVFLVNVAVMGCIWGLLRAASGSVIVASLGHGVWNGLAYSLFGVGHHPGALGVGPSFLFAPEVGVLGLSLNAIFLLALWTWRRRSLAVGALSAAGVE
jgi:membrane protease YdiL (CAAX protease family)